jgi:hypothetical protein
MSIIRGPGYDERFDTTDVSQEERDSRRVISTNKEITTWMLNRTMNTNMLGKIRAETTRRRKVKCSLPVLSILKD